MPKKTEHYYLHGKCKWAKLVKPDVRFEPKWNLVLYPTPESYSELLKIKEKGVKNEIKRDEDGYYVTISRPCEKTYKGVRKPFSAPEVLDGANLGPDGRPLPLSPEKMVGNGSDVTVHVEVFYFNQPFGQGEGAAMRLVSVRVNNLVPYEVSRDFDEVQQKTVAGFEQNPAPF